MYTGVNKNKFFIKNLCPSCAAFLHFVQVVAKVGHGLLKSLALLGVHDDLVRLAVGCGVQGVTGHNLPVIKHALGEGLSTGL